MSLKDSSTLSQLVFLEMTDEEITNKVITNIVKMLSSRKLLNKNQIESTIQKMISLNPANRIYPLNIKGSDIIIKISKQKMTSINKSTDVGGFLNKNTGKHTILVVKDVSKKIRQFIKKTHPFVEIFEENELMINIIENVFVPEHEVLSQEDKIEFYKTYNAQTKNIGSMFLSDPISRYYKMKIGDICRIKRPSETNCYINSYRVVMYG
jgi:DNA-directed RNA polymerase subunit H (RpoH/RPB5)